MLSLLNHDALSIGAVEYIDTLRKQYNIKKVRFTLPFQQHAGHGYWLDADKTGDFLADAFTYWHKKGGNKWLEIRPFEHLKSQFSGDVVAESGLCMFQNNCTDIAMTIMTDGEVSLCDNFAHPGSKLRFGNILEQPLKNIFYSRSRLEARAQVSNLVNQECMSCRYLGFCFGGCYVRSRKIADDITRENSIHDHYCHSYKHLFEVIENTVSTRKD